VVKHVPRREGTGKGFWAKKDFFVLPGELVGRKSVHKGGVSAVRRTRAAETTPFGGLLGPAMGPTAPGPMGPAFGAGPSPAMPLGAQAQPGRAQRASERTAPASSAQAARGGAEAREVDFSTGLTLLGFRKELVEAVEQDNLHRISNWVFVFADASGNIIEKWQEDLVEVLERNDIKLSGLGQATRRAAAPTTGRAVPGAPGVGPGAGFGFGLPPGATW